MVRPKLKNGNLFPFICKASILCFLVGLSWVGFSFYYLRSISPSTLSENIKTFHSDKHFEKESQLTEVKKNKHIDDGVVGDMGFGNKVITVFILY